MDAPLSPSGLDLLIKEWIWLSRDFRNQLSKRLHSRNSSPAVFTSLGLLSGSSPKHLNPAPPKSVLIVLPHIKTGNMVNTLNRNLQRVKRIWGPLLILDGCGKWSWHPRAQASEDFPLEVERLTPNFTVPVYLRCPQGPVCQPCHLVCLRAQRSLASAYLRVHPET